MRTMQSCFDTIIFVATYSQVSKLEINFDKPNKSSAVAWNHKLIKYIEHASDKQFWILM